MNKYKLTSNQTSVPNINAVSPKSVITGIKNQNLKVSKVPKLSLKNLQDGSLSNLMNTSKISQISQRSKIIRVSNE
jgi:hypothetical protein